METEYIKSMHSNFARILLEEIPDERKYQYCILNRGGIKGLLPCSLRKIDSDCYLYYDITSQQNITQMFRKKRIDRRWIRDFLWSLREIQMELDRFLLNDRNILWFPEYVYQDLENNVFLFMYMPYYEGENGFLKLLDFILENLDYEDEDLVEWAYRMYGQYEENGEVYLQKHIFEDAKFLENTTNLVSIQHNSEADGNSLEKPGQVESGYKGSFSFDETDDKTSEHSKLDMKKDLLRNQAYSQENNRLPSDSSISAGSQKEERNKRKVFSLFDRKARVREEKDRYRQMLKLQMEGQAVAEDTYYGEEYGRTFFVEHSQEENVRRLFTADEEILTTLKEDCVMLGKYENEVDVVVKDPSVSRIHARIIRENGKYYIEDMNSTNGTSKNGVRMKPYEKKILNEGDEIMLGKMKLTFR